MPRSALLPPPCLPPPVILCATVGAQADTAIADKDTGATVKSEVLQGNLNARVTVKTVPAAMGGLRRRAAPQAAHCLT